MVDVPKEMEHQENLLAIKKRSPSFEAQDPLKEVNLGTNTNVRLTKISSFSADNDESRLIQLIKQYKDCFV